MLRHPPHILVTTPESLYILLTAAKPRELLRRVSTVIVDEIHAVAGNKRGTHLSLSLERLEALVCGQNPLSPGAFLTGLTRPPQRIGLSATQNPISLVADFLTGSHPSRPPATIIQVGQRRHLDLAIEVPSEELGSLTSTTMWQEIFDKLAAHTEHHRSTLVFVNTRRLVEKISFELAERLGTENVAAHHGSLSRSLRLDAEQKLKAGAIKILVATASLELGIDIGDIDLVCQIATTRNVGVAMQRVGRAGHWRGAIPKGRLFATTRDDLLEQAALLRKMRAGELDQLEIPEAPIDVLMQQITASCGAESWDEDCLYDVLRRSHPYRALTREHFNQALELLHLGIESSRGRYGAYLLRDTIQGHLHPRRGARMIAISNGGAIPDTSLFAVILQPDGRSNRHPRRALRRRLLPGRRRPPRQHLLAHPAHRARRQGLRRRRPRRPALHPLLGGRSPPAHRRPFLRRRRPPRTDLRPHPIRLPPDPLAHPPRGRRLYPLA